MLYGATLVATNQEGYCRCILDLIGPIMSAGWPNDFFLLSAERSGKPVQVFSMRPWRLANLCHLVRELSRQLH